VYRRLVIETWAQQGVDVRMRRTVLAAVLVDRKDTLDAAGRSVESVPDGVA
jgi:hypothetical protein